MTETALNAKKTARQAGVDRVRVVVDTREQEPYAFDRQRVTVVRRALPAGDYSVEGWELNQA